ncbi:MAG: UDP-N-acetylmuramoyl-L-alanyl-D-glutamate--2,6-diaminopimelate ligase [Firmicutes bacterium]|nr:UDP-N-acetylmuramoyl-L-alanyl-D-glutamate--2,6-diaminopimelate ligase [Bacillota bacterium]
MLASELFGEKWLWHDTEISDITINSKEVKSGSVFICINGQNTDGHNFAQNAAENGAVAVVAEKETACSCPLILCENTKIEMAKISSKFYGEPEKNLKLIGITGTNGKTTVSYLVKNILETAGKRVGIIGTNEILVGHDAVGIQSSTPTTPNSLELHKIFAKMLKMGAEYVVMEVSSHALDLHRVYGLCYEVGVFTNLTRDHLDYHKTMENYFLAKAKLFSISKKGVINVDDEYGKRLSMLAPCEKMTVGTKDANLLAQNIETDEKGSAFSVNYEGETHKIELGISGMFSVYNALCALAAALSCGVDINTAKKGLKNASGVKGRLEKVVTDTDYAVIIDYAHTPDGLENVLGAVNSFKKGRLIAVFGCGGDRDATKRPIMGDIGTRLSDIAIITSDNPRTEEPQKIIDDILKGVKTGEYKVIKDRREAIGYALSIAKSGDVVLLLGKGQETYQILGTEKIHFDEREIVKEFLEK